MHMERVVDQGVSSAEARPQRKLVYIVMDCNNYDQNVEVLGVYDTLRSAEVAASILNHLQKRPWKCEIVSATLRDAPVIPRAHEYCPVVGNASIPIADLPEDARALVAEHEAAMARANAAAVAQREAAAQAARIAVRAATTEQVDEIRAERARMTDLERTLRDRSVSPDSYRKARALSDRIISANEDIIRAVAWKLGHYVSDRDITAIGASGASGALAD